MLAWHFKMPGMTEYRIGCSGYYYPYWKNRFYPPGVQPRDWLRYYSSVFNTVELNGTFYRVPKLADLQKYAAATPGEFRFSVKMSRYITHVKKLGDCRNAIAEFQDLVWQGLDGKLLYFLFQMPPSFHYSDENLERVLQSVPPGPQQVLEFRHGSWWNDTVRSALVQNGNTFCNVDFPGLDTPFVDSGNDFYLRLHGSPELFKSSYDQTRLAAFLQQFPQKAGRCTVYFNNTYYEAGYTNARELIYLIQHA